MSSDDFFYSYPDINLFHKIQFFELGWFLKDKKEKGNKTQEYVVMTF